MFKEIHLDIDYDKLYNSVMESLKDLYEDFENSKTQIAVQCRKDLTDSKKQLEEATMSLTHNWHAYDPEKMIGPPKIPEEEQLKEYDFNSTPDYFLNSPIESLNNILHKRYGAVRGRIMNMSWRSCLSWHNDASPRLHIPIKVNEGSFMVLEDRVCRFEFGKAYIVDTTKYHTAVNSGNRHRVHLVYCIDNSVIGTESP